MACSVKGRKPTNTLVLSGLPQFVERLENPCLESKSAWQDVFSHLRSEGYPEKKIVAVIVKAKCMLWQSVPIVILHFRNSPPPRSHLNRFDRELREIRRKLRETQPGPVRFWAVSPVELAAIGSKVLGLLAAKRLVLEGMRQKFFPWLRLGANCGENVPWLPVVMVDLLRTVVGSHSALTQSDLLLVLLCSLGENKPFY